MASEKLRKIAKIVKEITVSPSQTRYDISGLTLGLCKFFYRTAQNLFQDLASGDYTIDSSSNNQILVIQNAELLKTMEAIQVCYVVDLTSSRYETDFNVDTNQLKDNYNKLVDDVHILWNYIKTVGMVADDTSIPLILPQLNTDEVWVKTDDGYKGISLTDAEGTIKKVIEAYTAEMKKILDAYVEDPLKPRLDQYVEDVNKPALDNHVTTVNKPELDRYTTELEKRLQIMIDQAVADKGLMPPDKDWYEVEFGNWLVTDLFNKNYTHYPPQLGTLDKDGVLKKDIVDGGRTQVIRFYTTTGKMFFAVKANEVWSEWQELGEQTDAMQFTQVGHGFIFTAVTLDGVTRKWTKATKYTGADGIAIRIDDDRFDVVIKGVVDIPSTARDDKGNSYVYDEYYFLSQDVDGGLARDKPLTGTFQNLIHVSELDGKQVAYVDVQSPINLDYTVLDSDSADMIGIGTYKTTMRTADTIEDLKRLNLKSGEVIEVLGYYTKGDGANHKRIIADSDDGSGVELDNGKFANIIHNGEVNVSWFGAKGNGVDDDKLLIQKALTYCQEKYILVFDANKKYKSSGQLNITKDITIIGNNSELVFDTFFLNIEGSMSEPVAVTQDIYNNTNIIVSTLDVAQGDYLLLLDDTDFSFSQHRNYYKTSDILEVESKSGNNITTVESIQGNYKSPNSIVVRKFNMIEVNIKDLTITANEKSEFAIRMRYCKNSTLDNINTLYGYIGSVYIMSCVDTKVINSSIVGKQQIDGYAYGVSIIESKNIIVDNCYCYGERHGVAIGSSGLGICRNLLIQNSVINNDPIRAYYSADIHGGASDVKYINNTIYSGCAVSGYNASYIGNKIFESATNAPAILLEERVGGMFYIHNNEIISNKENTSIYPIRITDSTFDTKITQDYSIVIDENVIELNSNQKGVGAFYTVNDTGVRPSIRVSNLKIKGDTSSVLYLTLYSNVGTENTGSFKEIILENINYEVLPENTILVRISHDLLVANCKVKVPIITCKNMVTINSGEYKSSVSVPLKYKISNSELLMKLIPFMPSILNTTPNGKYMLNTYAQYNTGANSYTVAISTGNTDFTVSTTREYTVNTTIGGEVTYERSTYINYLQEPRFATLMKQENVYADFENCLTQEKEYNKSLSVETNNKQKAYEQALLSTPDLNYEDFLKSYPNMMTILVKPDIPKSIKDFMEKHLSYEEVIDGNR